MTRRGEKRGARKDAERRPGVALHPPGKPIDYDNRDRWVTERRTAKDFAESLRTPEDLHPDARGGTGD